MIGGAFFAPYPRSLEMWSTTGARRTLPLTKYRRSWRAVAREQEAEGNAKLANQFRAQCETMIGFTEYRNQRYRTAERHEGFGRDRDRDHGVYVGIASTRGPRESYSDVILRLAKGDGREE
jgi:hypothetical protein